MSGTKWIESSRRLVGFYLSPPADRMTFEYIQAIYEITETANIKGKVDIRRRTIKGEPLYNSSHMHGEHEVYSGARLSSRYPLFDILRAALKPLVHDCTELDEYKGELR